MRVHFDKGLLCKQKIGFVKEMISKEIREMYYVEHSRYGTRGRERTD